MFKQLYTRIVFLTILVIGILLFLALLFKPVINEINSLFGKHDNNKIIPVYEKVNEENKKQIKVILKTKKVDNEVLVNTTTNDKNITKKFTIKKKKYNKQINIIKKQHKVDKKPITTKKHIPVVKKKVIVVDKKEYNKTGKTSIDAIWSAYDIVKDEK